MTLEEQEAEDRKLIERINSAVAEYRFAVTAAWSAGLSVDIRTQTLPNSNDGSMWPQLIRAERTKVYVYEKNPKF